MTDQIKGSTSLTLQPLDRQFLNVVFQNGKPFEDAEVNFVSQIQDERWRKYVQSQMPSGWLQSTADLSKDFVCSSQNSNAFLFGNASGSELAPTLWANVNGWLIPVAGSSINNVVKNWIALNPPPASGNRVDMVFLEAWACLVGPNPSITNKPTASTLYRYGNVLWGGTHLDDDIEIPAVGQETTQRVQVQYRLRIMGSGLTGVDIASYPEGMNDPTIFGQGAAASPQAGLVFTNMADVVGDQGLWRAGAGLVDELTANPLGTIDGFVYAVPLCSVVRRNSQQFSALGANHNGGFSRTPTGGAQVLTQIYLDQDITPSTTGVVQVTGLSRSGIDDALHYQAGGVVFLKLGDEILTVSAVSGIGISPETITIASRARANTTASAHLTGATVSFWTHRPDGLFADEIHNQDIYDMRHVVNLSGQDTNQLLLKSFADLLKNNLKTAHKRGYALGGGLGTRFLEVSNLWAAGLVAGTDPLDGPDGIRTVWSDAAIAQRDVTVMLDPSTVDAVTGRTPTTFDQGVFWEAGATTLKSSGFIPDSGTSKAWKNNSVVELYLGGEDGTSGAEATFRSPDQAVRFLSPLEDDNGTSVPPWTLRLPTLAGMSPSPLMATGVAASYPGPFYPADSAKETPVIVLGGLAHADLRWNTTTASLTDTFNIVLGTRYFLTTPFNFDTAGDFRRNDVHDLSPAGLSHPLVYGSRNLYDLLTHGGTNHYGLESELYCVITGDTTVAGKNNNGVFKVVCAGTKGAELFGYTWLDAPSSAKVELLPLCPDFAGWNASGEALTIEFRTMMMDSRDVGDFTNGIASAVVGITDIQGTISSSLWNGAGFPATVAQKAVLNLSLLYHSGRGGMARVADKVQAVGIKSPGVNYLRTPLSTVDTTLSLQAGYPNNESVFPAQHVQTWNRIPSAIATQSPRESEVFVDAGSKTLVFRPFQSKKMSLNSLEVVANPTTLLGTLAYPNTIPKDGAGLFTSGTRVGVPIPPEFMPRFGQQDIPVYKDVGAIKGQGTFLDGVNHLFRDSQSLTDPVFKLIGGIPNTTGGQACFSILAQTGGALTYGEYGTTTVALKDAYQARLCNDTTVVSDVFGLGLKGIELPPHLGIARLYGIYERADYIAKGGVAFQAGRVTPDINPAINLLKYGQDIRTLYIREDGYAAGEHTYVVPENVVDITRIPTYDGTKVFNQYDYVVEMAVFGFATGFISENNYCLLRHYDGEGTDLTAVLNYPALVFNGVSMVLPCAANLNVQAYSTYSRIPYQGDPFGTRSGEVREDRDVQVRLGTVPVASSLLVGTARDQATLEFPNPRVFEVIASQDFYTTMGTGNIGGAKYQDTVLDCGVMSHQDRLSDGTTPWRFDPRCFTEQELHSVDGCAELRFVVGSPFSFASKILTLDHPIWGTLATLTAVTSTPAASTEFFVPSNSAVESSGTKTGWAVGILAAHAETTTTLTIQNLLVAGNHQVLVSPTTPVTGVLYRGDVTADNTVTIRVINTTALATANIGAQDYHVVVRTWTANTVDQRSVIAKNLAVAFNLQAEFAEKCLAWVEGDALMIRTRTSGTVGNSTQLTFSTPGVSTPYGSYSASGPNPIKLLFTGGLDKALNAGSGATSITFTGATERLPMGILFQDADFCGEDPLKNRMSSLTVRPAEYHPNSEINSLNGSQEYTPVFGVSGDRIGMSDGSVLDYTSAGNHRYRVYRGGTAWSLNDPSPGGNISWTLDSWNKALEPVLKSGVLHGKVLLVRNYPETAFNTNTQVSQGGEVQMVVLTYAQTATNPDRIPALLGEISPAGYGEGAASAERYRIPGKPLLRYRSEKPDPQTSKIAKKV